jgi:hypothetical protein
MEIADSNLKDPGPRSGASQSVASRVAKESAIGKRVVVGIGLLVLAIVLWSLRDTVPSWMAKAWPRPSELATTSDATMPRVTRAFDAAMHVYSADAMLESLPNQIRVRHTRLTVRAPTSDEAIEMASRMSLAMASTFAKEGPATLSIDVRHRTTPVEDSTTTAAGYVMRLGAAVAGLLGMLLIALGWFRFQASPDHLPQQFWWLAAGGSALAVAPVFLPGDIIMALFFMALPVSIAGAILWQGTQVRHAAAWPSTRGRIVRSTLRAQRHRMQADVTKVSNAADVEYEYTLGDRVFRGTRIGIGDIAGGRLEQTLNHYSVAPRCRCITIEESENALLERDPPVPVGWLYTIAAAIFLGGLVVLAVFWNISAIFEGLSAYFPEKAFPAGHGLLHPGRAHAGGHAVDGTPPGRRGVGLAGYRRSHRQKRRRTLSQAGRRRAERHAHDLLRAGGRIFISSERSRVPQHAGELWRQVGVLAGHRRSGCIALSHGQPGACALRSEEPLERRA